MKSSRSIREYGRLRNQERKFKYLNSFSTNFSNGIVSKMPYRDKILSIL